MPVKLFFCYAHEDEPLLNKLKSHLSPLQRQGLIDVWYDRNISAGVEWNLDIDTHLRTADIILLLISPDFMASDYCYSIEMQQAIERHKHREARVIPIILRPVYWQNVLGNLQALPTDAKPVTDPDWYNLDRALFNVTEGIRKTIENKAPNPPLSLPAQYLGTSIPRQTVSPPQMYLHSQASTISNQPPMKQQQWVNQNQILASPRQKPMKLNRVILFYLLSVFIGVAAGSPSLILHFIDLSIFFSADTSRAVVVFFYYAMVICYLIVSCLVAGYIIGNIAIKRNMGFLAGTIVGIITWYCIFSFWLAFNEKLIHFIILAVLGGLFGLLGSWFATRKHPY